MTQEGTTVQHDGVAYVHARLPAAGAPSLQGGP